jgi:type IV pilus assembly protein PilF
MRILFVLALLLVAGCANNPYRQAQPSQPQMGESLPSGEAKPGDAKSRAKAHTELGMLYYTSGQMATALDEARAALAADAGYAPAYNLLGLVHMYLNEHPEADAAFQRSISLAPNDPETNNNYGWYLCTRGREQEGIRLLMVAVKNPLYQTPTRPYTNAGLCSMRLKDTAAAEDYFRKAVQADRSNAQALYQLANLNFQRGNYYEAKRYVAAVIDLQDPNAETLWLAVRVERKLGDRKEETRYANQLRRSFSGSPEHQLLTKGQYE